MVRTVVLEEPSGRADVTTLIEPVRLFMPVPDGSTGLIRRALVDDPPRWLRNAVQHVTDEWQGTVWLEPLALALGCHVGAPRLTGSTLWRDLLWRPADSSEQSTARDDGWSLAAVFEGEIGLHAAGGVLMLNGTCQQPAGELEDPAGLRAATQRVGNALLALIGGTAKTPTAIEGPGDSRQES